MDESEQNEISIELSPGKLISKAMGVVLGLLFATQDPELIGAWQEYFNSKVNMAIKHLKKQRGPELPSYKEK